MIIYEVNLEIATVIFDEYMRWLNPHVNEMLNFNGFNDVKILQEESEDSNPAFTHVTVVYSLQSREQLQDYFDNHANAMRDDGLKRFGDQFRATRRIFNVLNEQALA